MAINYHVLLRMVLVLGLLLMVSPAAFVHAAPDAPKGPDAARVVDAITRLSGQAPFQTTRIYDRRGVLLAEIDDLGRRTIVGYDAIPDFLLQATIATEDRRFYRHNGVDYFAIARAAWQNAQSETIVSGGSTITQQLARMLFLSASERYEQTLSRKLKEAELAVDLERYYSKEAILAMYLNMAYYGHQAYGVAAAARVYFDKSLDELTPAEMALLVGLPQSPVRYDPLLHPQAALQRQRVVLSLMVEAGVLSAAQAAEIGAQPIHFRPYQPPARLAPHFVDYIRSILVERYGTQGIFQGLQVHTSLDMRYQTLAEIIARAQVANIGKKYHLNNAAVVMVQPQTGEILAMVGSVDFDDPKIDGQVNMTIEPRQPGSSIKPVLYAAAFDRGWSPASVIWDLPVHYKLNKGRIYTPRNITRRYYGPLRLRMALANSLNIPAIELLDQVGIPAMLETAQRLGIQSWRQPASTYGLSLAVGGYEVSLLELTHAFASIANAGVYTPLHPVLSLEDGAGRVLYRAEPQREQRPAISKIAAYQVASVLSDARARSMMFRRPSPLDVSQPAAVKTGTTDGWRDNLTVGFTSYLAVGVWTGNSDSRPMRNAIGALTAGPIWHDVMEAVWADASLHDTLGYAQAALPQGFPTPADAVLVPVCDWMPGRFDPTCPRMVAELFPATSSSTTPVAGRSRGYCLPAGAEMAPIDGYFMPLPQDKKLAARARDWMRDKAGRTVDDLSACDLQPVVRPLVAQPAFLPPKQWVKLPMPEKASGAPASVQVAGE